MTTSYKNWTALLAAAALMAAASIATAAPMDGEKEDPAADGKKDDPAGDDGAAVVGYEESDKNEDYKPKTDLEGATWTFDPQKVTLTAGTSETGTNFAGARILKGDEDVIVQGGTTPGVYDDADNDRYSYWQGSTFYFGVKNDDTGNSVDAIVEFFWFESSIPRGSDFYVMQVKVKSSPNPWDKWFLAKEPNFVDDYIFFWNDVQPSQHLDVYMEEGGAHGALRWDFCVPFETYKWEPVKVMQISESYGAGYSLQGTGNVKGKASKQFKEGGAVADLTADANIQAKGYVNNDFKVQSQYTITLYKWQMLVQSGGQDIHYKMVVLPHDKENQEDSGYYEYFIVVQAQRGTPVHIDEIEIGGMFRHKIPLWIDGYEGLSVSVGDIWVTPPRGVCLPGDIAPAGTCKSKGVCGMAEPECVDNNWACPVMSVYEPIETLCDGLDNDCDGVVDEDIVRECSTACGSGYEGCFEGKFEGCDAVAPTPEICADGVDNDCDGVLDNGCEPDDEGVANDEGPQHDIDNPEPDPYGKDGGPHDQPYAGEPDNTTTPPAQYAPEGNGPKTPVPDAANAGCTLGSTDRGSSSTGFMMLAALALMAWLRRSRHEVLER